MRRNPPRGHVWDSGTSAGSQNERHKNIQILPHSSHFGHLLEHFLSWTRLFQELYYYISLIGSMLSRVVVWINEHVCFAGEGHWFWRTAHDGSENIVHSFAIRATGEVYRIKPPCPMPREVTRRAGDSCAKKSTRDSSKSSTTSRMISPAMCVFNCWWY